MRLFAKPHEPHVAMRAARQAGGGGPLDSSASGVTGASPDGADSVQPALTAEPNAVAFEVLGERSADLRPAIYQLAVEQGWKLIELHRQVLDLEGIFRKLTQVV